VGARTQRRLINFLCLFACLPACLPLVLFKRTFDPGRRSSSSRSEVKSALVLFSPAYPDEAVSRGIFPANARGPSRTFPHNAVLPPPTLPWRFRLSVANYACPVFPCIQAHSSGVQSPSRSTGQVAPRAEHEARQSPLLLSRAKSSTSAHVDLSGEPGKGLPFIRHAATFENGAHVRSASRTRRSLKFRAHARPSEGLPRHFFGRGLITPAIRPASFLLLLRPRTRPIRARRRSARGVSARSAAAGIRRPETNSIPRRPVCARLASSDRRGRLIKDTCGFLVGISADMNINHRGK